MPTALLHQVATDLLLTLRSLIQPQFQLLSHTLLLNPIQLLSPNLTEVDILHPPLPTEVTHHLLLHTVVTLLLLHIVVTLLLFLPHIVVILLLFPLHTADILLPLHIVVTPLLHHTVDIPHPVHMVVTQLPPLGVVTLPHPEVVTPHLSTEALQFLFLT